MRIKRWPEAKVTEITQSLEFLSDRATGKIQTGATFIRDFVMNHPAYNHDSQIPTQTNFDLMKTLAGLNDAGNEARIKLLGKYA
jgi:glutamate--cysteine ligase catalytic subunit